jgi:PAS domain S-box-containing protein
LLGYTEKELQAADFASLIHPEDRKLIWRLFAACKPEKSPLLTPKIDTFTKMASKCGFDKFVSALHDEQGEPTHLIALVSNITQRKQAEEAARFEHAPALRPFPTPARASPSAPS